MVPFKYLSKFWGTLKIPLINCEINLILAWSANCVISNAPVSEETFAITDTKIYFPIVTLSIGDDTITITKSRF